MKRIISFLLALVLIVGLVPFSAMAAEVESYTHINPLYADVVTEEDLVYGPTRVNAQTTGEYDQYASTFEGAGEQLSDAMVARETTIPVYYQTRSYDISQYEDIFNAAVAHTGDPKKGDSLLWNYAGYRVKVSRQIKNGVNYVTFTYTMTYYTTAEQEAELDAAVDQLLATVNPKGSDYEKLCHVYDWICENITYDYDTLYEDDYKLKYSAYAAMIHKTSVCQGYATLLYRLALEMGIDCRVITGIGSTGGHGWNIIKLGKYYYNLDPTWDAIWYQSLRYYNYFLQNERTFTYNGEQHFRDPQFDTTEFRAQYPISPVNFDPNDFEEEPHQHVYTTKVTKPTCTKDGYTTYTCACGDSYKTDYTPAMCHLVVPDIGKSATCTTPGLTEGSHCDRCGAILTKQYEIPATGHNYFSVKTDTTCSAGGYITHICRDCGDSYVTDHTDPLGHSYKTVTINATCTEEGFITSTCTRCGDDHVEVIPAKGHKFWSAVTAPTCTTDGYTTYTCSACGFSYVDYIVIAPGHNWNAGVVTKEPTEQTTGLKLYTCTSCGEQKQEVLPKLDHTHKYKATVTKPTCTEKGYTTYTCACGDSYKAKETAALGHTEVIDKAVAATCTETGLTQGKHCSVCKVVITAQKVVAAKGHAEVIDKAVAATCTETGLTQGKHCSVCKVVITAQKVVAAKGHTEVIDKAVEETCTETGLTEGKHCSVCNQVLIAQNVVPAKGHSYVDTIVAPTCTADGYTAHTCACGDVYTTDVVAALGHAFENGACTVCGEAVLAAPVVKGSNKESTGKISLTWDAVEGAVQYEVYRATSKTGKYTRMKALTNTTYTNTTAKAGKYYYYYVRAIDADGNHADSNIIGRTCDLAQTTVTLTNVASTGKIRISWEPVEGATKYQVYRATSKNGTYSRISTTSNTSVTNTKVDAGKTYYYKVRAICDVDAAAAAYSAVKSRACDLPQPDVSIARSSGKPKVSWDKVTGAVEYKVYRATSKSGTYSLVKTTTSRSYKDTKATKNKTYYYKVVAVCKTSAGNSAYSNVVSIKATK